MNNRGSDLSDQIYDDIQIERIDYLLLQNSSQLALNVTFLSLASPGGGGPGKGRISQGKLSCFPPGSPGFESQLCQDFSLYSLVCDKH